MRVRIFRPGARLKFFTLVRVGAPIDHGAMIEKREARSRAREIHAIPESKSCPAVQPGTQPAVQTRPSQNPAPVSAPAAGALAPRKPISERKLLANRRNALLSTGPKTPEGKERVKWNALKHGLLSREIVNPVLEGRDRRAEFDRMLERLTEELQPVGPLEGMMVEEIAACYWRLRRVVQYENREAWRAEEQRKAGYKLDPLVAAFGGEEMQRRVKEEADMIARSGLAGMSLPADHVSEKILRYETAIKRQLFRSMERLEQLQKRRLHESARRPAADGEARVEIVFAEQTQGSHSSARTPAASGKSGRLRQWLRQFSSATALAYLRSPRRSAR